MSQESRRTVTRFAPSPTGLLHLGHAHSALFAERAASGTDGTFLLRIEDIDRGRCRPEFEAAILEDLSWLGLSWAGPVRRQSEHRTDYERALASLSSQGLLYPCFCTRREIAREIESAPAAPHGPDGPIYPGTCRQLSDDKRNARIKAGQPHALRLDMARARKTAGHLSWHDRSAGPQRADPARFGDVVLGRKDIAGCYHLAVTWDDALQGVTLVTRGRDLFDASHVHRLLQALLGLPVPDWHHHALIRDERGERLAKRHDPLSIRALRAQGKSPVEVRALAGFPD